MAHLVLHVQRFDQKSYIRENKPLFKRPLLRKGQVNGKDKLDTE